MSGRTTRHPASFLCLTNWGSSLSTQHSIPNAKTSIFFKSSLKRRPEAKESPILVVGLLHQGFHAYAEQLSNPAQKEWEKVAGRFEEILFDQPLEQASTLVATALNVRLAKLPPQAAKELARTWGDHSIWDGTARRPDARLLPPLHRSLSLAPHRHPGSRALVQPVRSE